LFQDLAVGLAHQRQGRCGVWPALAIEHTFILEVGTDIADSSADTNFLVALLRLKSAPVPGRPGKRAREPNDDAMIWELSRAK
jgi:hypothetical protein